MSQGAPPQNVQFPSVTATQPQAAQGQVTVTVCPYAAGRKKSPMRRFASYLFTMVFILSIVANVYLYLGLMAHLGGPISTKVLVEGKVKEIVAVYEVNGVI